MITSADKIDSELERIPTGISSYDLLMGGGFARGKITVLSGQPSVGKSTMALGSVREAQEMGLKALLYDVEYSYDGGYARLLGLSPEKLDVIQAPYAEEGLDEVLEAAQGKYALIIIDSIGALLSRQDAEKTTGEKTIGAQAGLVAKFVRKIVPILATKKVALVLLTHEFTDIMSGRVMASGGAKMMYHASQHIRLKQKFGVVLKQGDSKIGKVIVAEMKKNKLGSTESKEADAHFIFGEGFSSTASLLDEAIAKGVFKREGNSYFLGETKLGTISKLREWAKENEATLKELTQN
jgi:recombination protein RecA